MSAAGFTNAMADCYKEYERAKIKHGQFTMDGELCSDMNRISALVEEVGEVGRCLTYDKEHANNLRKELIQVANVALTWASILT